MSPDPTIQYVPIKTDFRSRGFHYLQLKREGDIAIYLQTSLKTGSKSWEVIKITRHNGYKIAGNSFPPAEMYPSNSQWGTLGWTYTSPEDAEVKFQTLLGNPPEPVVVEPDLQEIETETNEEADPAYGETPEQNGNAQLDLGLENPASETPETK